MLCLLLLIVLDTEGQSAPNQVSLNRNLCQEVVQVPANFSRIQDLFEQGADINCNCEVIQRTYFIEVDRIMINFFSPAVSEIDLQANADDNYLIERVNVTPIHIALSREDYSLMRFLLEQGADLNTACCDGMYPLEFALHHNKKDLVDFLMENGADPKQIELGCPFNIEMAKYMISKGADANTIKIDCALWDKKRALALLKLRPDLKGEDIGNFNFRELLDKPKMLTFLLENGFSPNGVSSDGQKKTLLHLAAELGKIETIELLLEKHADIEAKDVLGFTPLCHAVKNNHQDILRVLINEGAKINVELEINNRNSSPLSMAVRQRNERITTLLLENGADSGLAGEDLLAIAVNNDDRDIVASLVKYGDEPNRLVKLYGQDRFSTSEDLTGFMLSIGAFSQELGGKYALAAIKNENYDIASMFIKHKTGLNSTDDEGKSPLHYALINNNYPIAYLLIEAGADLNQQIEGFAPYLHRAVRDKNMVMVHKLLQNGANVSIKDVSGKSALSIAVNERDYELAKLLLRHNISITCEELFKAIYLEHISMVKLLVENGADLACRKDKLSPQEYAKKHNISYHIEQYLKGK